MIDQNNNNILNPIIYNKTMQLRQEIELKKKQIEYEKLSLEFQAIKKMKIMKASNKNNNIGIKRKLELQDEDGNNNNHKCKEPSSKKRKILPKTK